MKLEDCTKAELIEIIKSSMFSEFRIGNALMNIEQERKRKKLEIAHELHKECMEHLNAYIGFCEKYDGAKLKDIPHNEAKMARIHLDKYGELSKKSSKIRKEVYGL